MKRTWTDQELRTAISSSLSFKEVIEKLGLKYGAQTCKRIKKIVEECELDTTHFKRSSRSWTDKDLEEAVRESVSLGTVIEKLQLKHHAGNYRTLKKNIARLGLDISHFQQQRVAAKPTYTLKELLIKHDRPLRMGTTLLKKRLLKEEVLKNECSECGQLPEWNGKPLTLQLDHIDGDTSNNELDNLRILCPHCHSQTETFGSKNRN